MVNASINKGFTFGSLFLSLKDKLLITLLVVVVYRIGTYVPLPFIDPVFYANMLHSDSGSGGGLLGMANVVSGGALGRHSVFSLNVMPYIVASIVTQLFFASFFTDKKTDSSQSRNIGKWTRYLTLFFAVAQGLVLSFSVLKTDVHSLVAVPAFDLFFRRAVVLLSLVAGSSFLVWLGEVATAYGMGNGISLIIFTGIVGELPSAIYSTLELGRVGVYSGLFVLLGFLFFLLLIAFVVFMERSSRNVPVFYPKRQISGRVYSQHSSYIPIKINISGVIPAIFANTVMLLPASIAGYGVSNYEIWGNMVRLLYAGGPLYYTMYFLLIVFFSFFYTSIVFNPVDIAENIKKAGGVIGGMKPGAATAAYIQEIVARLTCIGAAYMAFVCIFVDVARVKYSIPFALGGTSVLIMVSVVNDIISQVRLHALGCKYESSFKKFGVLRQGGGK